MQTYAYTCLHFEIYLPNLGYRNTHHARLIHQVVACLHQGVQAPEICLRRSITAKSKYLDFLRGNCFARDVVRTACEHVEEYGSHASFEHHVIAGVNLHNVLGVSTTVSQPCQKQNQLCNSEGECEIKATKLKSISMLT